MEGAFLYLGSDDSSSICGASNSGAVFGGLNPNLLQLEQADVE